MVYVKHDVYNRALFLAGRPIRQENGALWTAFSLRLQTRQPFSVLATTMALVVGSTPVLAMDIVRFGDQVVMSGDVVGDECVRLQTALDAHPEIKTVVMRNSRGGNARAGYCVGELLRTRGINTAVSGHCNSSCSRMFLGGTERRFTGDEDADRTWIAFHSNYDKDGNIEPGAPERLKAWITKYTDGRVNEQLLGIWTHIANHQGFVYFFDSNRVAKGTATIGCTGDERGPDRFAQCAKYPDQDAYSNGIVTSSDLLKTNDHNGVPAAEKY